MGHAFHFRASTEAVSDLRVQRYYFWPNRQNIPELFLNTIPVILIINAISIFRRIRSDCMAAMRGEEEARLMQERGRKANEGCG